jgi:hypothetical protein
VGVLVNRVALKKVFVLVLRFSPVGIIPPMLHTHSSTTYAIGNVKAGSE